MPKKISNLEDGQDILLGRLQKKEVRITGIKAKTEQFVKFCPYVSKKGIMPERY